MTRRKIEPQGLTPTQRAQKGKAASPWSKHPNCEGLRALASYNAYRKQGKVK